MESVRPDDEQLAIRDAFGPILLADRRRQPGSFARVAQRVDAIELRAEHWNSPKPFIWIKTADEIVSKVGRGRAAQTEATSGTDHNATEAVR
jgi:hypothetical protein